MSDIDNWVVDSVKADERFLGLDLTEEQIEFVKAYEKATQQRLYVTDDVAKYLNVGVHIGKTFGYAADFISYVEVAKSVGTNLYEGDIDGVGKNLLDLGLKNLLPGAVVSQLSVLLAAAAINPVIAGLAIISISIALGECGQVLSDILSDILGLYDDAGAYTYPVDPLIFDLDGDGIETVSVKNGVNFDFDKNGFAEKIGWAGADDGLLVRDLNANGNIDNGGELFGDLTAIADGVNAVNGFEALAAFDLNGDGVIDAKDTIYSELKIWQDENKNGVADEGELLSLKEAGIAGIGLDYDTMNETDEQGNAHTQKGYYIKTDGSTALVEDVWFDKDAADTVVSDDQEDKVFLEETDEIRKLPDIQGKGNQYSLHQAIFRDENGVLKQLVEDYIAKTDRAVHKSMLPEIIYVWTDGNDTLYGGYGNDVHDGGNGNDKIVFEDRDDASGLMVTKDGGHLKIFFINRMTTSLFSIIFMMIGTKRILSDIERKHVGLY